MNRKRRLNCYVFCNLIVSLLTLNVLTNPVSKVLVEKTSNNTLNEIYEREVLVVDTPDTIISDEIEEVVVEQVNNNQNEQTTFNYVKPSYNSLTGNNLVNYAMQFLGLRYVSAGNSLATGTDCSGFTRLIYQEFGISLGRTVSSQIYSGSYVSRDDLQPGDLVFYSYGNVASHVAIYIGNGLIIHESTPRDGVKISSVNIMNYITARRLITANVISSPVEEVKQEVVVEQQPVETNSNEVVEVIDSNVTSEEVQEEVKETESDKQEEIVVEKEENKSEEGHGKIAKRDTESLESSNEDNNEN